jgi:hypothetical protein
LYSPPNQKPLQAKTIDMLCTFYKIENTNTKNHNREAVVFARNYKGFVGDLTDVCNTFNISVTVFGVEYKPGKRLIYEVLGKYEPALVLATDSIDLKHINLLPLFKEQNNGHGHYLYIKNVEALMGFWLCPVCKNHIIKTDEKKSHFKRDREHHLKTCQAELTDKIVKLEIDAVPCAPQYTKNKLYTFCTAHNIIYQPTRFYITYDFETGDRMEDINEGIWCIHLEPISVSMAVFGDQGIYTKSYSVLEKNWIEQFVDKLYEKAEEIRSANINSFLEKNTQFIIKAEEKTLQLLWDL